MTGTKFTEASIKALKHGKTRYEVVEPSGRAIPGSLSIRIEATPSSGKTWYYLYRGRDDGGRSMARRLMLGRYPAYGLKEARQKYLVAASERAHGKDPAREAAEAQEEQRKGKSVREVAEEYLSELVRSKLASASEIERMLDRDVLPAIGSKKIKDVRRRDLVAIGDDIRDRGAYTMANRVLTQCSGLFGHAIEREYIETNPAYRLKRTKELPRDRVLSPDEIHTLWLTLPDTKIAMRLQLALRLLLVTGQRRSEVVEATYAEFDRQEKVWEIPPLRTKKGRPHIVPLSDMALGLLDEIESESGGTYLFPSPARRDCAYNPRGLSKAVLQNNASFGFDKAWTVHDLRRTVNTEMGRLGMLQHIIDRVQGRIEGGTGSKHYNRYDYFSEKRSALDEWAARLAVLTSDAPRVVSIGAGR